MNDGIQASDSMENEAPGRKAWVTPSVIRLAAGSAENVPGSAIFDGPLETTGS